MRVLPPWNSWRKDGKSVQKSKCFRRLYIYTPNFFLFCFWSFFLCILLFAILWCSSNKGKKLPGVEKPGLTYLSQKMKKGMRYALFFPFRRVDVLKCSLCFCEVSDICHFLCKVPSSFYCHFFRVVMLKRQMTKWMPCENVPMLKSGYWNWNCHWWPNSWSSNNALWSSVKLC